MWYMNIKEGGIPIGWDTEPSAGSIEVSQDIRDIHLAHPDYIWDGTTLVPIPAPVIAPPTTAELILLMTRELEQHYDAVAQVKQYDNRLTCALRAGYAGPFQTEGTSFAIWMDNCNIYGYQVIAACLGGQRVIPTFELLKAELPNPPW